MGYIATLGHEFMYIGSVQFDIVIVTGFLQEAGRVCIYVCVYAFVIIWVEMFWGVDVLGSSCCDKLQLLLNVLRLGFWLAP